MNSLHQIQEAGFRLELLPHNKFGVRPSTLTVKQHDYLTINKVGIMRELRLERISKWLHIIGEPEEDHYLVLDKCRNDPQAMEYFMQHENRQITLK